MTPEEKAHKLNVPLVGTPPKPAPKVIAVCQTCGDTITADRAKSGPCRMMGCPISYSGVEGL